MKKYLFLFLLIISASGCNNNDLTSLERGFDSPPEDARAGVYWYFMDGNLSSEGITKDLEAMKRAGIGYVLFLEVNVGVPRGTVDYMSEEWQELFVHAVHECERLGIKMVLGIGPGWNGSGGPWVEGEQSMQHLVSSSVTVTGGKGVQDIVLPVPQPKRPFFGKGAFTPEALKKWEDYYSDVAVLAFPAGATVIDTAVVSGVTYMRIPEIDERALYYRKPYSSVEGVPQYIPLYENLAPHAGDKAIDKSQIIDLTSSLQPDGSLKWEAPAGQWVVMRFGARNNGAATRPAPVPGVGFEADKMDTTAMIAHFGNFTGKLFNKLGFTHATPDGGGIKSLHIDSWEMGAQNWTKRFREEFTARRGYDPQPYYPVYAGLIVQNREVSERFLWDLRFTAQELFAEYHVGFVRRYAHRFGLDVSIEPYDMNPAADMELAAAADVPMAEFWGGTEEFDYYGYNTSWGAAEASSVANLIGQHVVPAEAFTAAFDGWKQYPASVKNQGDWAFAAGINRLMYHTFQHQPLPDNVRPGMTMGIYGLHWDRNQTWWYLSDAYHRYVARCQYMLQQGRTSADILYLAPEGAPHVFRAPASAYSGKEYFPDRKGYSFDACPPSLLYQASVEDGCVVFPSGATYRILVLPCFKTMRPQLLAKIVDLVRAGATVVGLPPVQSPSLSGYPVCDNEVRILAGELWGKEPVTEAVTARPFGKGKIIFSDRLRTETDNLYPNYDFTANVLKDMTPPDFSSAGEVRYTHHILPEYDFWFLASRTDQPQDTEVTLRISGVKPELWHPVTGERRPLPEYTENNGLTTIPLHFEPYESYFVVFSHPEKDATQPVIFSASEKEEASNEAIYSKNFPSFTTVLTLDQPWQVKFDPKWGGPENITFNSLIDWRLHDNEGIKYYSGTAFYKTMFELSDIKNKPLYLNLGKVKNIARITLNGKDLGVVWTAPWQVEISSAVKKGKNELTVEVVNLWANRLIGDEQQPEDGITKGKFPDWLLKGEKRPTNRYTFTTHKHYKKDSPLLESGLLGPVRILTAQ